MAAAVFVNSHNLDTAKNFNSRLKLIISKFIDFQANVFI